MSNQKFPALSRDVVEALEGSFPNKPTRPTETHAELMFRGGQQDVINFLRRVLKAQENETAGAFIKRS